MITAVRQFKMLASAMFAVIVMALGAYAQTWDCGAKTGTVTATWSNGTLTISGEGAMANYDNLLGKVPWNNAKNSITGVVIEDGVISIGTMAFENCVNLTSATIGNSVTSIGGRAFASCTSLISVTIPNSVTSIGDGAFYYCSSLTSVTIPNSVTSIGIQAFQYCSDLISVTIPNSVTSLGYRAFDGCTGLTSVTIGNGITSIGTSTFESCSSLTSVIIPNSVTSIGYGAFEGCTGLTSVTIPNSVTSIGGAAFSDCIGLTSVTIPNSVTSIGSAFYGCTGLISVIIGSSVTSIDGLAFDGCINLTSVTSLSMVPPNIASQNRQFPTFDKATTESACLYVPEAVIELYRFADGWGDFTCIQAATVSVLTPNRIVRQVKPLVSLRGHTLTLSAPANSEYRIRLIDMRGKTVTRFKSSGGGSFSLAKIPAGRYVVEARGGGKVERVPVVVGVR